MSGWTPECSLHCGMVSSGGWTHGGDCTHREAATGEAPAASPEKDWRLAEGAAPRREGDDLSPEEAIRLIRGHGPVAISAAQTRALLLALEKIIAEVSERRVGHREKIAEIARTAIDQARADGG